MVVDGLEARISDSESSCFFFKYFNQSRIQEWGKEGEGVRLLSGVGRGAACNRGHSQVPCGMAVRGGRRQSIYHSALHMSQRRI